MATTSPQQDCNSLQNVLDGLARIEDEGEHLHGNWALVKSIENLASAREALVRLACDIDLADRLIAAALYDLTGKRAGKTPARREALSALHGLSLDLQALTGNVKKLAGMHGAYAYRGQVVQGWGDAVDNVSSLAIN